MTTTEAKAPKKARRGRSEGSVFQRGDGRWVASVSDGYRTDGKRKRITVYSTVSKADVIAKLAAAQREKTEGRLVDPTKHTVGSYLDEWLTEIWKGKDQSRDFYSVLIEKEIKPRIGSKRLQKLTKLDVLRLYRSMATAGKSAHRQQRAHLVLRKALADAADLDLIPFNPAASKKLRPKYEQREPAFLTPEQVTLFLNHAAADRLYAMWQLCVAAGLRQGECFALRWSDVDLDNATLTVQRTQVDIRGKISDGTPKSAKSRRTISLSPATVSALWQHKARMLAEGYGAKERVFVGEKGGPLRRSHVCKAFHELRDGINAAITAEASKTGTTPALIPFCTMHSLRHSHATAMLKANVNPKVVSSRLGHSRISITMDLYQHTLESLDREAAEKVDAVFAKQA